MKSTWLNFLPKNQNYFIKRTVFSSPTFQTSSKTPNTDYKIGITQTNPPVSPPALPEVLASAACTTVVDLFTQGGAAPMLCRIPAGEKRDQRVLTDAKGCTPPPWLHFSRKKRSSVTANVFSEFVKRCECTRVYILEPQG